VALFWNDSELQELWTLSVEELALLPDGTDKGRLSFAIQLKFMALHGRFPERHDEIQPAAVAWGATQLSVAADAFAAFELDGRQGRRYRRVIRAFLGFRLTTAGDLERLSLWLSKDVLPFDPQARHGRDLALDWCRAEHVEPPALDHMDRVIRSTVHRYETGCFCPNGV
jgi:hypothetical protein